MDYQALNTVQKQLSPGPVFESLERAIENAARIRYQSSWNLEERFHEVYRSINRAFDDTLITIEQRGRLLRVWSRDLTDARRDWRKYGRGI